MKKLRLLSTLVMLMIVGIFAVPNGVSASSATPLPADMEMSGNTEHDAVIELKSTDSFSYTGALDVSSIKTQMDAIKSQYPALQPENIALSNVQSEFTTTITVPTEKVDLSGVSRDTVTLEGSNGVFEITDVQIIGGDVSVKIALIEPEKNNNI